MADGERKGLSQAIRYAPPDRKVCILSDSTTAIHTALQLSSGAPPRSGIEIEILENFLARRQATAVAWIRGHIGLEGNTIADKLAELHSHLGIISLLPRTATTEGVRAASRAARKDARTRPGFGARRTDWHRHALSAYTWYRTETSAKKNLRPVRHVRQVNPTASCRVPHASHVPYIVQCVSNPAVRQVHQVPEEIFGTIM